MTTDCFRRVVAASAWLAACATAGQAFAQNAPPPAAAPAAPPAAAPDASAPAQPPQGGTSDASLFGLQVPFLQRLPPEAFPENRLRGLYGGSLWGEFTDLQWPYYPRTGIGVSGSVWLDSGYEHIDRSQNPTEQGTKYWLQQGRMVLRFTPTWSDGKYFVQGQAELVANKDQSQAQPNTVDVDDMWIKAGKWKSWDIQLGRYQGWEVYHFGMGMDLYTLERNGAIDNQYSVPSIYGLTYAYYRPAGVGQAAAHIYPTDYLRFELGTQFGNEYGENTLAVRPVGILDFGPKGNDRGPRLRIKGGAEWKNLSGQADQAKDYTNQRGAAGAVQVIIDPVVEFGVNAAYGIVDHVAQDGTADKQGSYDTYSVGGFANVRIVGDLMAGAGFNFTRLEDQLYDPNTDGGRFEIFTHTQTFVALQYIVAKQLFVKVVGAYANGWFRPNFNAPVFHDEMLSGRVRLQYLF